MIVKFDTEVAGFNPSSAIHFPLYNRHEILNPIPTIRVPSFRKSVKLSQQQINQIIQRYNSGSGGTASTKAVLVAGLAEAFAGALSMGAGEFIAGKSEALVQKAEVKAEIEQMKLNPQKELEEFVVILESEGVKHTDALVIAQRLSQNPQAYAKTMVEKELGLDIEPETVKIVEGFTIALSYIVASIVPLISYFFLPISTAFLVSLGLSFLFLVILGIVRGKLAKTSLISSTFEIILVGTVSGLGGYLLGTWLPKLFGY